MYVHVSVFVNFGEKLPNEWKRHPMVKKLQEHFLHHLMFVPFFRAISTKDSHASSASSRSDGTWASDATWAANPAHANDGWDDWGMHAWDQARSSA